MSKIFLLAFVFSIMAFTSCNHSENKTATNSNVNAQDSSKTNFELINKKIIEDPNNADLYIERALFFKTNDQIKKGIEDIQRAISIDSLNAKYHLLFGEYSYLASDIATAKKEFEKSISLDNKNPIALIKLAEIYLLIRDYKNALSNVNDALKINERLESAYYMKGFIFKEMNDTTSALSSFQTAIEVNPNFYDAYIMLGLLNAAKKNKIAEEYYKTALTLKPKSAEALYDLGMYYQENNQPDKAIETYAILRNVDPKNALADYNTGYIYMEILDDNKFAVESFSNAIKKLPTYAEAYYNRGLAYERMGFNDNALSDYKKALELKSNYQLALEGMNRLVK
jgi:tetratricopeptide (TPR) repeat protein